MLFDPIQTGTVTLPNRIAVPAMVTRLAGSDGFVNDEIVDRYTRFAEGGAGLVVIEATSVHGGKSGPLLRASSDEFVPGLARVADAVHAAGPGKLFLQIIHFLKIARSGWRQKIGDVPREDIEALPAMFAAAARRAQAAGMDGVELHMAHAYTLSSLLSRRNKRRDGYGCTLENRMRLPTMVMARVREAVGDDFPVGVRYDAEECIKDGYSLPDSAEFAVRFAELGAAYVSLSAGGKFEDAIHQEGRPLYPYTGYSGDRCMPGSQYPDAFNVWLAEGVRSALRARGHETPVLGSGKIGTVELAEQLLVEGRCDIIGMARALLADPWWPIKAQEGRFDEVVRCIYCNVCKNLDENFKTVVCYLWPRRLQQAPRPGEVDRAQLEWPDGDTLSGVHKHGRNRLQWPRPKGDGLAGFDVFRSIDGHTFDRLVATTTPGRNDDTVVGGRRYSYYVQAYDRGGRRGLPSNIVEIAVPRWAEVEDHG